MKTSKTLPSRRADLASSPTLVTFQGVSKTYDGKTHVVKNLDLEIRKRSEEHTSELQSH